MENASTSVVGRRGPRVPGQRRAGLRKSHDGGGRCPHGGLRLSASLFCVRCGYPNVQGHNFCPNCGNPVYTPPPAAAPPPVAGAPSAPGGVPPAYPAAPSPYPVYPPPYGYGWSPPPPKRATIGRMIEDTFRVFLQDPFVYMGVYFLVALITVGATLLLTFLAFGTPSASTTPSSLLGLSAVDLALRTILLVVAVALLGAVVGAVAVSTLTHFAVQRYRGAPETLGQAFGHGLRRFLSVLGAQVLLLLLIAAAVSIPVTLLVVGALAGDLGLVLLGALLVLVLAIVLVYAYVALSLYIPAIVMEGQNAVAGLRRSWDLTRGHRLDIFVAVLVVGIVAAVVSAAITAPLGLFGNPYLSAVGTILVTVITGAWSLLFSAVAYHLIVTEPPVYYGPPPAYAPVPPVPPR